MVRAAPPTTGRWHLLSPLEPALRPNRSGWATDGWITFQGPPWRGCQGGLQRMPCCISNHVEMLGEAGRIPGWTLPLA